MDEESNQRRVSPNSFFDQIAEVRETADRALEFSEDNLKVIEETKTSLEGIKFAIEDLKQEIAEFDIEGVTNSIKDLKSEVKEINDYITVERKIAQDVQEDLRLETEDAEQKQERSQRLKEMGVPSSDGEQPQPTPAQQVGNALQDNIKQGGAVGGMLGAGLLQLLAPLLGGAMIPAMLPMAGFRGLKSLFGGKGDKGDKGDGNFITRFFDRGEKSEKDLKEDIKKDLKNELGLTDKGTEFIGGVKKGIGDIKDNIGNFFGGVKKKITNFDGRPGSRETKNKSQENDVTNPESSTFSTNIQYSGRLGPGLKFIVDESSLEPGVTPEKAEQHYYKKEIDRLEDEFRKDIIYDNMSRETAIDVYGPESNLYRFKQNYNNTLEYGGYELDVGKHYDFVKKSYSSSNKKDKKENKLMDFVKEGGVAGFLNRKLFGKKDEEEKGINTYSDGGGEEKKENKLMNFVKQGGVVGFLGRKLFGEKEEKDEEKKSKGEKVTYKDGSRTITIDKGGFLDSLSKEDAIQKFTELNDRRIKAELAAKKGDNSLQLSRKEESRLNKLGIILEGKFKVNTRSIKSNVGLEIKGKKDEMNLIEVDPNFDFDDNPYEKKKSIQPIIESDNKNLQSNVFQPMDNNQIIVVENNANQEASGTGNETVRVPANQPNTQDSGELVMTDDPSSFLKTIKNEQLNIASSNVLPHQVAQNLK